MNYWTPEHIEHTRAVRAEFFDETTGTLDGERLLLEVIAQRAQVAAMEAVASELKACADNAYCDMISDARKTPCLGWKAKVARGTFGQVELDAHVECGRKHGKHKAYYEAYTRLRNVLASARPTPTPQPEQGDDAR